MTQNRRFDIIKVYMIEVAKPFFISSNLFALFAGGLTNYDFALDPHVKSQKGESYEKNFYPTFRLYCGYPSAQLLRHYTRYAHLLG